MHELSIIESAIQIAEDEAKAAGAKKVHRLRFRIGKLSGVVPEALEFAFDVARRGTMLEEASIDIELTTPVAQCKRCGHRFECDDWNLICPKCGNEGCKIVEGLDVQLVEVEVE